MIHLGNAQLSTLERCPDYGIWDIRLQEVLTNIKINTEMIQTIRITEMSINNETKHYLSKRSIMNMLLKRSVFFYKITLAYKLFQISDYQEI